MAVLVMGVGKMAVGVGHSRVDVGMGVAAPPRKSFFMGMVMVHITMVVYMAVHQRRMGVAVGMTLCKVQRHTGCHQRTSHNHGSSNRLAEQGNSQQRPKKRGN